MVQLIAYVLSQSDQVRMKGTVDWLEAKLSADRFDMQIVTPMYPGRLARLVSNIAGPSSNLMYHCHSHTQLKVLCLQHFSIKKAFHLACSLNVFQDKMVASFIFRSDWQ